DGVEYGLDRGGRHQRRCAAAEEDRLHGASGGQRGEMRQLAPVGGDEAGLVEGTAVDMRIEIAIGAFGGAEGPVDIDAEETVAAVGAGQQMRIAPSVQ